VIATTQSISKGSWSPNPIGAGRDSRKRRSTSSNQPKSQIQDIEVAKKQDKFPYEDAVPHQQFADKRAWILEHAPKGGVGAEFGVFRGHFSTLIMREVQPSKLYLVDPWTKLGERYNWSGPAVPDNVNGAEGTPYTEFNRLTTAEAKDDARRRLREYDRDRVEFCESFEQDWCKAYAGEALDFVYLDSSHYYVDTLLTLVRIDRLLKQSGIILGDDWYWEADHYSGVCRAVNDFVRFFDYEIIVCGVDAQFALRRTPIYTHPHNARQRPMLADILNRVR
jgi:hypothetical protein